MVFLLSDKPSPVEDFPMRAWNLRIFILDEEGNELAADVFTKVVYNLHPTFENPHQSEWPPIPNTRTYWVQRRDANTRQRLRKLRSPAARKVGESLR